MMFKILTALLFLCPLSGCMVALPLCSQIQNMKPNCVCPMPLPACRGLFKWDDDIGFMPKQPTDDVRPNYQITAGEVVGLGTDRRLSLAQDPVVRGNVAQPGGSGNEVR